MIVSALLQPCYNLLHAILLHSGWWPLIIATNVSLTKICVALKQFVYLPIAFVNVTQIFVKLTFVAMIKNGQQNFLLNQQISFCSVCAQRHQEVSERGGCQ